MHLLHALLFALFVGGTDPAPLPPAPSAVRFPTSPVVPAPMPPPVPSNVITQLNPGEWYLLASDVEYVWKAVPAGVVQVIAKPSGFTVAGRFAGGTGQPDEERTYKDAFVYHIKPVGAGPVTLIGTPKGKVVAGESDIVTQTLTVGSPAPVPPTPDPTPAPVVDALQSAAQAAFDAEPKSVTKATDKVVFGVVLKSCSDPANWLNVHTVGDLTALIHTETESRIQKRLLPLRSLVGTELGKVLPADRTATLTAQNKTDAAKVLEKLAAAVDATK